MDWFGPLALLLVGASAGAINAVAGGGSLLTLPLLVFLGLPETVANATNRIGVLANSIGSAAAYQRTGHVPWGTVRLVLPATLLGSALGAWIAARLPDAAFRPVIGAVLVAMAAMLAFRPARWLTPAADAPAPPAAATAIAFFAIGVYGGFIQAGIGFFLVAASVRVAGHDLVRANGVKVALTLLLTVVAILVFAVAGEIRWIEGALLAAGSTAGGWIGARTAVRRGAAWIRWVLVAAVLASAFELLGIWRAIGRLLGL